jgi:hypothetical protein
MAVTTIGRAFLNGIVRINLDPSGSIVLLIVL